MITYKYKKIHLILYTYSSKFHSVKFIFYFAFQPISYTEGHLESKEPLKLSRAVPQPLPGH